MFKNIFITGAAGFIGFHLCKKLLESEYFVIGIDNINDYYDIELKKRRLDILNNLKSKKKVKWEFIKTDLIDEVKLLEIFKTFHLDIVVNLAAQAGVRYSIENPYAYIDSNIKGFLNILEGCRNNEVKHLVYASSSSVYG